MGYSFFLAHMRSDLEDRLGDQNRQRILATRLNAHSVLIVASSATENVAKQRDGYAWKQAARSVGWKMTELKEETGVVLI